MEADAINGSVFMTERLNLFQDPSLISFQDTINVTRLACMTVSRKIAFQR